MTTDIQRVGDPALAAAAAATGLSRIEAVGDAAILHMNGLSLLCSQRCPGDVILRTYDAIRAIRDAGIVVMSGFHSSMEQDCLELLLRGKQPVIVCPARSLQGMRIPSTWRRAIEDGRLLLLSAFDSTIRRTTRQTAFRRNAFVIRNPRPIFIPHASSGGEVHKLATEALREGRTLYTLPCPENAPLMAMGGVDVGESCMGA